MTNRDLLVSLNTEVKYIKKDLETIKENLRDRDKRDNEYHERLVSLEEKVKENTKLRGWVSLALIGIFIEAVIITLKLFLKV